MDAFTIAALAINALQPFLLKSAEKFAEHAGEEIFAKRGEIWEKVKSTFAGGELITLNLLEKYPENGDIQKEVSEKLSEKLKSNPQLANELQELLKQIPSVQNKQNTINQSGDDNIANQDISGSTITIKK